MFVLFILWANIGGVSLVEAAKRDPYAVSILLERTTCHGSCPDYEIRITGEGDADYKGNLYVRTPGPEHVKISNEQETEILKILDRADFYTLDDRAFEYCFDTPRVIVTLYVRGITARHHSVSSDASCVPKSGPQAELIKAANAIDKAVNSEQWTKCHGNDCIYKRQ